MRGLSIKYKQGALIATKRDKWNDALKYMLVNLKVLLHWVMKDQSLGDRYAEGTGASELQREVGPDMAVSMAGPARGGGGAASMFHDARSMFNVGR